MMELKAWSIVPQDFTVSEWWASVGDKNGWKGGRVYHTLAALYFVVGLVALVQLVRIQRRVPEYGWTTQKVFHLLNFVVNFVRAFVFVFREQVQALKPHVLAAALLDLPGLLFFTTYTLLVLFWAEIYHQARGLPTESLRPAFLITNAVIYAIQLVIWVYVLLQPQHYQTVDEISKFFFAAVSLVAAIGFALYGGRLFLMLHRFPIESRGRRKKLHEVGFVTAICFVCFLVRAIMIAYSGINQKADLDIVDHPILNLVYYLVRFPQPSEARAGQWQEALARCGRAEHSKGLGPRETDANLFLTSCAVEEVDGLAGRHLAGGKWGSGTRPLLGTASCTADSWRNPERLLNGLLPGSLHFVQLVELVPSALVLYILRKLPPKRTTAAQPIP